MKTMMTMAILFSSVFAQDHGDASTSALASAVQSILSRHQGTFAVAWKDLQTGRTYYHNETEMFHAASTMKTPVMVEVFNQAEHGKFSLDDSIEVVNRFTSIMDGSPYSLDISDDSEDSLYSKMGRKVPIRDLITAMITRSSNFATNLLIEKITADSVMRTLNAMGLNGIHVLRGVEDLKAFDAGRNNTTNAIDMMRLYEDLAQGTVFGKEPSRRMVDVLLQQKFNEMIPGRLPKDVRVAHKTGSITNVQHDAGIVYLPDGTTYVLVVLSKDLASNKDGVSAIAEISRAVYDFMVH